MNIRETVPTTTTRMSTKGQIVLPKAVRERLNLQPGAKLVIEDTPEGVLIRRAPLFPPTTVDEVFGSLKYCGPPVSIEDMDTGVMTEARRRARD